METKPIKKADEKLKVDPKLPELPAQTPDLKTMQEAAYYTRLPIYPDITEEDEKILAEERRQQENLLA